MNESNQTAKPAKALVACHAGSNGAPALLAVGLPDGVAERDVLTEAAKAAAVQRGFVGPFVVFLDPQQDHHAKAAALEVEMLSLEDLAKHRALSRSAEEGAAIDRAAQLYAEDDDRIELDPEPLTSESEDGVWVNMWALVPSPEA